MLGEEGIGCIAFSPLAQGLLTDRYLSGVPEGSRASEKGSLGSDMLSEDNLAKVGALRLSRLSEARNFLSWRWPGYSGTCASRPPSSA